MRILKSKRGIGLVDLIVTLFLLAMVGLIFTSTFTAGFACLRQSSESKVAAAVAQEKIEQLRSMNYESLTQPLMFSATAIDASPDTSPYSFTQVDHIADKLCEGTGTVAITDETSDVKRVTVTVSWRPRIGHERRSLQLTTYFADKRPRRVAGS